MAETGLRILVAEDEELVRRLLVTALRTRGYRIDVAESGADALEKLRSKVYDALVTDCRMPMMTGLDLIRWLKSASVRTPVVLMSSHTPDEIATVPDDLAGVEFLRKPFGLTELYTAVQRALQASR